MQIIKNIFIVYKKYLLLKISSMDKKVKVMKVLLGLFLLCVISFHCVSADFSLVGGANIYLSTDFSEINNSETPRLTELFNSYKGVVKTNSLWIGTNIDDEVYYGRISVQGGDYNHNFRTQQLFIQEAYAGFRLTKRISLEAGYFLSNKGKQILTNNSEIIQAQPMYMYFFPLNHAGVKFKYKPTDEFLFGISLLNSVQDVNSRTGNLAVSPAVSYMDDIVEASIYGIFGNESFGDKEMLQIYNVFELKINVSDYLKLSGEFTYRGIEAEEFTNNSGTGLNVIKTAVDVKPLQDIALTLRLVYTDNQHESFGMPKEMFDYAFGAEYKPSNETFVRIEFRAFDYKLSEEQQYIYPGARTDISLSFGFLFDEKIFGSK